MVIVIRDFFLNYNCLLSHPTLLKATSPPTDFLGYIYGWTFEDHLSLAFVCIPAAAKNKAYQSHL